MITYLRGPANSFSPDEVVILSKALDEACAIIMKIDANFRDGKAVRNGIAKYIVEVAQRGERNKQRLRDGAVEYFTKINLGA